MEAEAAMLAATSGINTHRGAIFGLGLLCAAAGARAGGLVDPELPLGDVVSRLWGRSILDGPVLLHSHGSAARRRFRAGGARIEAAQGFPSVYQIGLPALRRAACAVPDDAEAARVEACFALIASVEDTNLLHRGGLDGLRFARRSTRHFLDTGGVRRPGWRERAQSVHERIRCPAPQPRRLGRSPCDDALRRRPRKAKSMMSNAIVMALAPVFFVLLLGYAAGKFHIVDNHHVDGFNALVMNFALPASLFAATASASRSQMIEQAPLFLVFGLTMLMLYVAWYWGVRAFSGVSRSDASLQALTIGFPNLAGVGLPIVASVLGPTGTVPVAVALASGSILISPLTLIIVEMSTSKAHGGEISGRQILTAVRRALTKPIVVAPALGILLSLSGLKLGALADACLSLIGNAAAGVALFLTGLILSAQSFRARLEGRCRNRGVGHHSAAAGRCGRLLLPDFFGGGEDGDPARRRAVGLLRHPLCRELSAGLCHGGFHGHCEHRLQHRDDGDRHCRALLSLGAAMALAILCSGQGRQHPDMFALTGERAGSRGPVCACGETAWRHGSPRFRPRRNQRGRCIVIAPARSFARCRRWRPQRRCETRCPAASSSPATALARWRPGALEAFSARPIRSISSPAAPKPWMRPRSPATG